MLARLAPFTNLKVKLMKRQFLLPRMMAIVALVSTPVLAQSSLLPTKETVPAPAPTSTLVSAENFLNPLHEEEWVTLDGSGNVSGQFVQLSSDGASKPVGQVALYLTRNGAPLATVVTTADGRFVLPGLEVGTYGLVGRSDKSLAAFALHVLPNGASQKLDSDFVVYGTTMNGETFEEVLRAHTVPGSSAVYPDFRTDPVGDARRFSSSSQVQLRANGTLVGRVSRPSGFGGNNLTGNVVHVIRNGIVVGHESTNSKGEFQVTSLNAGVYDFVVAGKDGIAAGSFVAVEGTGVAMRANNGTTLVSAQTQSSDSLNVELIPSSDFFAGEVEEVPPTIVDDPGFFPVPGGGFVGPGGFPGGGGFGGGGGGFGGGGGGFGGGGGGGLGGLGGIGGLLGIGGLAAGVAALAANDDNFTPVPATTFGP